MTDDLAHQLEEQGHKELADALRRKQLASELRDLGETGLAARVEGQPAPDPAQDPTVPMGTEEEEQVAAVTDALRNAGIAGWEG